MCWLLIVDIASGCRIPNAEWQNAADRFVVWLHQAMICDMHKRILLF